MRGRPVTFSDIKRIRILRETGHSLPEIRKIVGRSNSTVYGIIKDVAVDEPYASVLRAKQGGSKARSVNLWNNAAEDAEAKIGKILKRDRILILAALYWGEGNKTELDLINSDPQLVRVFITCLRDIGVRPDDLRVSLRLYEDIPRKKALLFWSQVVSVPVSQFGRIDVLAGKKEGKLQYGMCRVRVRKGGTHFKLLMSMIKSIKSAISSRSSTDRTSHS